MAFAGARADAGVRRGRIIALVLTIALHLLVVLALFLIRGPVLVRKEDRGLIGFLIPAPAAPERARSTAAKQEKADKRRESSTAPPLAMKPPPLPVPSKAPAPPPTQSAFIEMDSASFSAGNIGRIGKASGASAQGDSKVAYGPGEGPGGATLYKAEWYRRPTGAELSGYLPANAPRRGWGIVACKTVENYRVDNCRAIGESPPGSGFARAVRQAAWQFRVLPPRKDGQAMIGAWVSIRITYGMTGEGDAVDESEAGGAG